MCWKIQLLLGMELYYNNSIVLCGSIATYQSRGEGWLEFHNLNIAQSMSRTGMRVNMESTQNIQVLNNQNGRPVLQAVIYNHARLPRVLTVPVRMQGSVISGISHYFQDNSTKAVSYSRDHRIIYCVSEILQQPPAH